jgi:hypothetical protein
VPALLFLSLVMIAAYRWPVRSLERRSPDELGTPLAARWLALGATAGTALFGVVYAILWRHWRRSIATP